MIGETILHYKILEKLGEGGMGIVYKAEDTKLKREVAIKFLPRYISSNDEEQKRFEIEAQAAASLNHSNISTIHSIEKSDDQLFIVMEFIDGVELKEEIKNKSIPISKAVSIAIQIVEGLEAAHKKGIIHRDIKSSNIMIMPDGKVKIMDFGLAKIKGGTDVTKIGSTVGTVAYMSPEQAGGQEVDLRTDLWSFGIVLYEMLMGEQPFKGAYEQAIIYSILNEEPEFGNIPEDLSNILMRCIAKSASDRYQNVGEVLNDLRIIKENTPSKSFSKKTSFKKNIKKSKLKWLINTAAILIIAVVTLIYFFTKGNNEIANTTIGREMIVIMPFENLGSQDDNYFADGITDEITSKLASIGNIGVISTKSAKKIASANKTTAEIGKELGVNYILSGTIRWAKNQKNGSTVRITPQLTRVSDNTIAWSDSYDKVLNDIFAVQNDIAQKVVDQLGGSLLSKQIQKETPPTSNLDAYDFYLQGLAYLKRGINEKTSIQNSTNLLKKALELDPKYASAYANLSKNLLSMYWFYFDRSKKNISEAFDYAQRAFQLNPNLAETHIALGYYYYWYELNYDKAIKEFSESLKIQPNNAEAFTAIGYVYRRMGNLKLALKNMEKGLSLDPLSAEYAFNAAETLGLLRDYENANKYYKQNTELNPDFISNRITYAQNFIDWKGDSKVASEIMRGVKDNEYLEATFNIKVFINIIERNYDQAIQNLKSLKIDYETGQFRYTPNDLVFGLIYRYKNERGMSKSYFESSRMLLEKMLKDNPKDERIHSSLGIVYAGLGNKEKAIAEGKKGIELLPLEKEAYRGYYRQWDLAIIYTLISDYDNALKQIDFILSIPGAFSVNQLKLDPLYDPIRNLPGYKTIIDKYFSN